MTVSLNKKTNSDERSNPSDSRQPARPGTTNEVVQCHIFKDGEYLGWDCFENKRVSAGKSKRADITLNDDSIADIQAMFYVKDNRIIAMDAGISGTLKRNNKPVKNCIIGPLDFITIGKYTLKLKLKKREKRHPVPVAKPSVKLKPQELIEPLPTLSPEETHPSIHQTSSLYSKKTKQKKIVASFEHFFPDNPKEPTPNAGSTPEIKQPQPSKNVTSIMAAKAKRKKTPPPLPVKETRHTFPPSFFASAFDAEDMGDAEDMEGEGGEGAVDFSLQEELSKKTALPEKSGKKNHYLEVLKLRRDTIVSINHLSKRDSLHLIGKSRTLNKDDTKGICVIKKSTSKKRYLYFNEPLVGKINASNGTELLTEKVRSLKGLVTGKATYKTLIQDHELCISDGIYDFILRPVLHSKHKDNTVVPHAKREEKKQQKKDSLKYLSLSLLLNILFAVILSVVLTVPASQPKDELESRFVVIETNNIHTPQKPKPLPPKPPARPQKPKKKAAPSPKKAHKNSAASLRKKATPKTAPPKAGGGNKGTIANRNINELGLLASLGSKSGVEAKQPEALAAITNMDAVTSSHSQEAQFKIGGLVGNLESDNLAIPTGKVVNTKGSTSVLRSAGISGKGNVAALENGNTGKGAVRGVVSMPLTKKVRVKGGGISRADVEKVIRQHIDEVNYCYETALLKNPSLMGKVVFEWRILLSGDVGEVQIKSSTVNSSEIHTCIKSAIRTWKFPKPKGQTVMVSYPFVFDISGY